MYDLEIIGVIAAVIAIAGYAPYLIDLAKRRTKPHAFSWIIWFLLQALAFSAAIQKGAGFGALVVAAGAVLCFVIFICGIFIGEKNILTTDKICFAGALIGVFLLVVIQAPLDTVILTTIVDAIAFVPTFRKAYYKPHEETITTFALSSLAFFISLFALSSFNTTTALYPASLVVTNGLFVIMVAYRRHGKRQ